MGTKKNSPDIPPKGSADFVESFQPQDDNSVNNPKGSLGAYEQAAASLPTQEVTGAAPIQTKTITPVSPAPNPPEEPKDKSPIDQATDDYSQALAASNKANEQANTDYLQEYANILSQYNQEQQDDEAEKEAMRKRARRAQVINSITDGISAIANLLGTTGDLGGKAGSANMKLTPATERYQRWYEDSKAKHDALMRDRRGKIDALTLDQAKQRLLLHNSQQQGILKETEFKMNAALSADARIKAEEDRQWKKTMDEANRKLKDKELGIQKDYYDGRNEADKLETQARINQIAATAESKGQNDEYRNAKFEFDKKYGTGAPFDLGDGRVLTVGKEYLRTSISTLAKMIVEESKRQSFAQDEAITNSGLSKKEKKEARNKLLDSGLRDPAEEYDSTWSYEKKLAFVQKYIDRSDGVFESLSREAANYEGALSCLSFIANGGTRKEWEDRMNNITPPSSGTVVNGPSGSSAPVVSNPASVAEDGTITSSSSGPSFKKAGSTK